MDLQHTRKEIPFNDKNKSSTTKFIGLPAFFSVITKIHNIYEKQDY